MRRSPVLAGLMLATAAAALMLVAGGAASTATPYGKWTARMTKGALLDYGLVDPRMPGMWRLELRRNGTYQAYNPLDGWTNGKLAVSGARLVVSKDPACEWAKTDQARYRWVISKGKLRLRSVTPDACGGRWQTLTIPMWGRS
jgi:hypothetical protein